MIRIHCANPACRKGLKVPDEQARKKLKCPACGHPLTVPAQEGPPNEAIAPPPPRTSPPPLPVGKRDAGNKEAGSPAWPSLLPWVAGGVSALAVVAVLVAVFMSNLWRRPQADTTKEEVAAVTNGESPQPQPQPKQDPKPESGKAPIPPTPKQPPPKTTDTVTKEKAPGEKLEPTPKPAKPAISPEEIESVVERLAALWALQSSLAYMNDEGQDLIELAVEFQEGPAEQRLVRCLFMTGSAVPAVQKLLDEVRDSIRDEAVNQLRTRYRATRTSAMTLEVLAAQEEVDTLRTKLRAKGIGSPEGQHPALVDAMIRAEILANQTFDRELATALVKYRAAAAIRAEEGQVAKNTVETRMLLDMDKGWLELARKMVTQLTRARTRELEDSRKRVKDLIREAVTADAQRVVGAFAYARTVAERSVTDELAKARRVVAARMEDLKYLDPKVLKSLGKTPIEVTVVNRYFDPAAFSIVGVTGQYRLRANEKIVLKLPPGSYSVGVGNARKTSISLDVLVFPGTVWRIVQGPFDVNNLEMISASPASWAEKEEKVAVFDAELLGKWLLKRSVTATNTSIPFGGVHHIAFSEEGKLNIQVFEADKDRTGASYTIDATQTPRHITVPYAGKSLLGIYEVKGKKLRICFVLSSTAKRPQTFNPTDAGVTLWELEKE